MGKDYKPVYMDMKGSDTFERENKGIFKTKLSLALVVIIIVLGHSYMTKKQAAHEQSQQTTGGYNTANLTPQQQQHFARQEADRMVQTGDVSTYEHAVRNNPELSRMMGMQ